MKLFLLAGHDPCASRSKIKLRSAYKSLTWRKWNPSNDPGFSWNLPGDASFQWCEEATRSYISQGETTEGCVVSRHALFNPSDCVETPLNSGLVSLTRPLAFNGDSVWKPHRRRTWNRKVVLSEFPGSGRDSCIPLPCLRGDPGLLRMSSHVCRSIPATRRSPATAY